MLVVIDILIGVLYVCIAIELLILFCMIGCQLFFIILAIIFGGCVFAYLLYKFVDVSSNSKKHRNHRKKSKSTKIICLMIINALSYLSLSFSFILLVLNMLGKYSFLHHIVNIINSILVVGGIYAIGLAILNNLHRKISVYHTRIKHMATDLRSKKVGKKYKDLKHEKKALNKKRLKEYFYMSIGIIIFLSIIVFFISFWLCRNNEYKYM